MDKVFHLAVYSADRPFYEGDCISLIVPTNNGMHGILAHHFNVIAAIVTGEMTLTTPEGKTIKAAISGGMIKIENNDVLILVDTAERPEDIDRIRAERDAAQAQEAILQKKTILEYKDAHAKLARAINRLKVKNGQ